MHLPRALGLACLLAQAALCPGLIGRATAALRETAAPRAQEALRSHDPRIRSHAGRISLRNLDLSRPPTEAELRRSGQLGSPLSPSRPADPGKATDPRQRRELEEDNRRFGQAMQLWNEHRYPEAATLFRQHRREFTNSPWAGESELHLGCQAQFSGDWEGARGHFEWILANHEKGSDIYQKAKLRRAVLHLDQGQLQKAVDTFGELLESEGDWERRTYAHHWIRQVGMFKGHQQALRDCGKQAVAFLCAATGQPQKADQVRAAQVPGEHGFSVGELRDLIRQAGLTPFPVRADMAQLARLPVPFIAHYRDRHFVVVSGLSGTNGVRIYDPRLQRETELTLAQFGLHWSGLALLLQAPAAEIAPASAADLADEVGGCCGIPRYPNEIGPLDNSTDPSKDPTRTDITSDPTRPDPDATCSQGLPVWQVNPVSLNLVVQDIPMWHDNPLGYSIFIHLTYNSQDSLNQVRPFGKKWIFNYSSYAMESPGGAPAGSVLIVMPGGSGHTYQPNGSGGYNSPAGVLNKLRKVGSYAFELEYPSGAVARYGVPPNLNGTSSLLLSIDDRHGNRISINYNSEGSIASVVDSQGRSWDFFYNLEGYVSRVEDPFGRSAQFSYNASGHLISQVDMGGTAYSYTYDTNVYLTSITTPNGTTRFYIEPADGLRNVNPYPAPGAPMWENYRITITDPMGFKEEYHYNGYSRYTWYRDKNQYRSSLAPLSAPKTRFQFGLVGGRGVLSGIVFADGSQVTYSDFDAQRRPRVITDPNGNITRFTYNAAGMPVSRTDARGFTTRFEYAANQFDLVRVIDPLSNTVAQIQLAPNRNVVAVTDALNRRTGFSFNSRGQLVTMTNALGQLTTILYDAAHQPVAFQRAGQTLATMAYDPIGRVQQLNNADGYAVSFTYDGRNRPVRVSYPGGAFLENVWGCCRLEARFDHVDRTNRFFYDGNRRLVLQINPMGQQLRFEYDPVGNLTKLVDPMGRATRWEYDARNRASAKIYADGTAEKYTYDRASRVVARDDADGHRIEYVYDQNGNLTGLNAPGVPTVQFAYDALNRRTQMLDGFGTTQLGYNAASQLVSVDGPWVNDTITYGYDAMGRTVSRTIGSSFSSVVYDALGRVVETTNALGRFVYEYSNPASSRLSRVNYPNGQFTLFSYFPPGTHQLLQEISHRQPGGGVFSRFAYDYDPALRINSWVKQSHAAAPVTNLIAYDQIDQLIEFNSSANGPLRYAYDALGNRVREERAGTNILTWHNALNQIVGSSQVLSNAVGYGWDSLGRLRFVTNGPNRTEFQYDGLGRRVRFVESVSNVVTSTRSFLWTGAAMREERDASGAVVTKQYLDQGEKRGNTNLFYLRDHLGSVCEVADSAATCVACYDFEPYGTRRKRSGSLDADFGFTSHYFHRESNLHLPLLRAYDANLGRWISRDPNGESETINLYAYVGNSPIQFIDPDGAERVSSVTDRLQSKVPGGGVDNPPCARQWLASSGDAVSGKYGIVDDPGRFEIKEGDLFLAATSHIFASGGLTFGGGMPPNYGLAENIRDASQLGFGGIAQKKLDEIKERKTQGLIRDVTRGPTHCWAIPGVNVPGYMICW